MSAETKSIALPVVPIDKSARATLLEGYVDSVNAIAHAVDVLRKNEPNAQNYYFHRPPFVFADALEEHYARIAKLEEILVELRAVGKHISGLS